MQTQMIIAAEYKFSDAEPGSFTGYGSIFGNEDLQGDVMMRNAFAESIRIQPVVPFLWQHRADAPIGSVTLSEDARGLRMKGQLLLDVAQARECHVLMRASVVTGASIGYETLDSRPGRNGVRELHRVRCHEISAVTFPANVLARIDTVRHNDTAMHELAQALRSIRMAARNDAERRDAEKVHSAFAALRATIRRQR